jgi:hypothetical protein
LNFGQTQKVPICFSYIESGHIITTNNPRPVKQPVGAVLQVKEGKFEGRWQISGEGNGFFLKSCFGDFPSEYATSTGNHQFATEKWAQFEEANSPLTA